LAKQILHLARGISLCFWQQIISLNGGEAIPLKKVTSESMVEFVKEHIIYRFGIPQTITTDQGTQFTSSEFREFAESMGIKLLNSSPYYAQANGQAEASNKIMIKII
jgi:transposase InsO family protein